MMKFSHILTKHNYRKVKLSDIYRFVSSNLHLQKELSKIIFGIHLFYCYEV